MSYVCADCIAVNRLTLENLAPVVGDGAATCEICWESKPPLTWVRVLNAARRGRGPDKEWLERVKNRPLGVSMEDITRQIREEDRAAAMGAYA